MKNWKERSKNKADWEESIKEAKVRIGLWCHLIKRSEGGGGGRRRRSGSNSNTCTDFNSVF